MVITELLLLDLAPLAEARKYNVCYCSFWHISQNPAKALRRALEESLDNRDWKTRVSSYMDNGSRNIELSSSIGGTKVALKSNGKNQPPQEDDLVAISDLIDKLAKGNKRTLLLLDEVQHLATNPDYEPLVATLRTLFDIHRKKIHVVFTGSSRDGLMRMFRDRKAPMFHASQQIDLPLLEADFVSFMVDCFEQASGKKLSLPAALRVFNSINSVPALFHQVLRIMLINGVSDIEEGYSLLKSSVDINRDYQTIWNALKGIDQAVLKLLCTPLESGLYTEETSGILGSVLGVDNVSVASVQNAIDRLRKEQIIFNGGKGVWHFEDESFKEWLLTLST